MTMIDYSEEVMELRKELYEMTHTLNTDKTVAVSPDHYWLRIDNQTPRGVKILLLGIGGVASIGQWDGKNKFWRAWTPLPKKPDWLD